MIRSVLAALAHAPGITLTEILISIMILGIGLVSLATLFPIGLLRLRDAQRQSRSAYLSQSASADLGTRGLLTRFSFINTNFSPWYTTKPSASIRPLDPGYARPPIPTGLGRGNPNQAGVYRGVGGLGPRRQPAASSPQRADCRAGADAPGPGLPVAYDPLWRFQVERRLLPRSGQPRPSARGPVRHRDRLRPSQRRPRSDGRRPQRLGPPAPDQPQPGARHPPQERGDLDVHLAGGRASGSATEQQR